MNSSYKRYWEPSLPVQVSSSVLIGFGATVLSYPAELLKTLIQARSEGIGIRQKNHHAGYNPVKLFQAVHSHCGGMSRGIYRGFETFAVARCGYLVVRNTIYRALYDIQKPVKPTNDLTTREKAVIASIAGGIAAFVTSPFELVNVRQIVDLNLPKEFRRNYQGIGDAFNRIVSSEGGNKALFRGAGSNVAKAVALNATLTTPYDACNETLYTYFGDNFGNRWISLFAATLIASFITLPFDNIKTRLQKAFPDPSLNRINYAGFRDCFRTVCQVEGFWGLYAGYYTYFLRVGIYGWFTLLTSEGLLNVLKRKAGLRDWEI